MIQNIFQYDNMNNRIELNIPEILLVSEFSKLMDYERNICKEDPKGQYGLRAFREFTYIWLALDWKSIYSNYTEQERHQEALRDARITEEEFNDPDFRAACRKYRQILESEFTIRMLKAALNQMEKLIDYFNNIDPEERDPLTGKPIFKVKDIMAEMSTITKVYETLKETEALVKKELIATTTIRGNAREDFDPGDF